MHADQRAADVQTGIGPDLLQRHGMPERLVRGGGEGAARLGLGHYVDNFGVGHGLVLHDDGAVQMLTALGGDIDAHGPEHAVQPLKDGGGDLRRGPAAHLFAHYLAGAASYHHDLPLVELGRLGQLGRRIGRLPLNLFMQTLLLQLMHDTCHKKTPRSYKD